MSKPQEQIRKNLILAKNDSRFYIVSDFLNNPVSFASFAAMFPKVLLCFWLLMCFVLMVKYTFGPHITFLTPQQIIYTFKDNTDWCNKVDTQVQLHTPATFNALESQLCWIFIVWLFLYRAIYFAAYSTAKEKLNGVLEPDSTQVHMVSAGLAGKNHMCGPSF